MGREREGVRKRDRRIKKKEGERRRAKERRSDRKESERRRQVLRGLTNFYRNTITFHLVKMVSTPNPVNYL